MDAVALTQELVRFDTINPPGNEAPLGNFIADLLSRAGFQVARLSFGSNRVNIVARRGRHLNAPSNEGTRAPICFTGHLDTVPLGNARWKVDPFAAEIIDGRLYGRGSSDMKSGVAAMVAAAVRAGDKLDQGPGVVLVLTSGEETGCDGAKHLVKHTELGRVGALIVGEPTGNEARAGHKGALWMNAETFGHTAHGSMPELGVNAIFRSLKLISKLEEFGFNVKRHEGLGSPTLSVGRMWSGTNINSVPDHSEIGIDVRTIPGMRHAELIKFFENYLAPELDALSPVVDLESVWTDVQDSWVRSVLSKLGPNANIDKIEGVPFFTDASVLAPALEKPPVLILGPGETAMAHQTDEYCFVSKIDGAVRIYEQIMTEWQIPVELPPLAAYAGA